MSKGKEENRACLQNANIAQILCEGKVKYKVVLFCPLFVLPGLFLAFLVGSLSSHGIGSQSVWHVLHVSWSEVLKVSLGFNLCYLAFLLWKVLLSPPHPETVLFYFSLLYQNMRLSSIFILEVATYFIMCIRPAYRR